MTVSPPSKKPTCGFQGCNEYATQEVAIAGTVDVCPKCEQQIANYAYADYCDVHAKQVTGQVEA